jgi:hypothetical protein
MYIFAQGLYWTANYFKIFSFEIFNLGLSVSFAQKRACLKGSLLFFEVFARNQTFFKKNQ